MGDLGADYSNAVKILTRLTPRPLVIFSNPQSPTPSQLKEVHDHFFLC